MLAWDPYECEKRRCALERVLPCGHCATGFQDFQDLHVNPANLLNPVILSNIALQNSFADLFLLRITKLVQLLPQIRTAIGEDSNRKKCGVCGARLPDRERADRNPARHLDRC